MDPPDPKPSAEAQEVLTPAVNPQRAMLPPASKGSLPPPNGELQAKSSATQVQGSQLKAAGASLQVVLRTSQKQALEADCWFADNTRQAAMKAAADAAASTAHLTPAQRERAINEAASQVLVNHKSHNIFLVVLDMTIIGTQVVRNRRLLLSNKQPHSRACLSKQLASNLLLLPVQQAHTRSLNGVEYLKGKSRAGQPARACLCTLKGISTIYAY